MTCLQYLEEVLIIREVVILIILRYQCSSIHDSNRAFDLFVILAPTSSDEFQEIDGESEERRRARLERHQRTRERAVMLQV